MYSSQYDFELQTQGWRHSKIGKAISTNQRVLSIILKYNWRLVRHLRTLSLYTALVLDIFGVLTYSAC